MFGFPDRLLTRLRYSDVFSITSTSGAQGLQVYRWNSTFDPDLTNAGHQPLYRDTYASIYDQYAVVSAKAIVRIFSVDADTGFQVNVNTDDDATFSTLPNVLAEQSHGITHLLSPLAGSKSNITIVSDWSAAEYLNIDPFTSQTYKTAVGSNPTEISFLGISVFTTDATTGSVSFQISLEQEILWTELATPSAS